MHPMRGTAREESFDSAIVAAIAAAYISAR
jgi:hypothetical protein